MTHFAGKAGKILVLSVITTLLLAVSAAAAEDSVAVAVGATTGSSLRLRAEANGYGREVKSYTLVYAAAGGALLLLVVCLVLVKKVRKRGKVR